jgi:hypothetical protein
LLLPEAIAAFCSRLFRVFARFFRPTRTLA